MTLLAQRDEARRLRRLGAYAETRGRLRVALAEILPGERVIVFGSLTRPGVFHDRSDVDLALEHEPAQMSAGLVMLELAERLRRAVDVVVLPQCRFREKIEREGESWTL